MNFGYFDDEKREYVITRPDTPAPWANYLGSPEYGALISNNAGGYSFARSGANGRILRTSKSSKNTPIAMKASAKRSWMLSTTAILCALLSK